MENFDLECIHLSLKDAVNETLGDVAKDSIESNNFQMLHLIAKLGIDLNTFIDGMFISPATVNVIEAHQAKIAETEEVYDAVEVEEVTVETTTPKASKPKRKLSYIRKSGKPEIYGLSREDTKDWLFNYLGSRGGRAHIDNVYEDYYKQNNHLFNENDLIVKNGKPKWKQNITHRASTMRENDEHHIPLLEPVGKGPESKYYVLTKKALADYNKKASTQLKFNCGENGFTLGA